MALDDEQQSAYDELADMFRSYGLPTNGEVMDVLRQAAIDGDSADLTQIQLQDTPTWKQRFAGNEVRRKAGLNVLTVAQYLQQESQYADILHQAGLPSGFYDDPSDFSTFIGDSVSPAEVQARVNAAADVVNSEDPSVMEELSRRGLTKSLVLAHALDPDRAKPVIQREMQSVLIGAAGMRAGINTGTQFADNLASRGVTAREAAQSFGQAATIAENADKLGNIYGIDYNEQDALAEVFNQDAGAKRKRKQITDQEKSEFGGSTQYGVKETDVTGAY